MNKITLPSETTTDANNNDKSPHTMEDQQMTTDSILLPGVSSSFLMPTEEF